MKALLLVSLLITSFSIWAEVPESVFRDDVCRKMQRVNYNDVNVLVSLEWEGESCNEDRPEFFSCKRLILESCKGPMINNISDIITTEDVKIIEMIDVDPETYTCSSDPVLAPFFQCHPADEMAEANYIVAQINNFQIPSPNWDNISRAPAIVELERNIATKDDEIESDEVEQAEVRQE